MEGEREGEGGVRREIGWFIARVMKVAQQKVLCAKPLEYSHQIIKSF